MPHCHGAADAIVVRAAGAGAAIITRMTIWFVFNGDADGLCAAHQLRLAGGAASPPAQVITGVKRDIGLLARCDARPGDTVWVADISLDANRAALERLLARGVQVTWFDHHYAGAIPVHANLRAQIDTSAAVCSGLLVDHSLAGRYRAWAVTAAFGDNLDESARDAARSDGLAAQTPEGVSALAGLAAPADLAALAELGVLMNYNAYGETVADLHVDPAQLFERIAPYPNPHDFLAHDTFAQDQRAAMQADLAAAHAAPWLMESASAAAVELPNAAWARRAQGVFANQLARAQPQRAHAIVVRLNDAYSVSVRAPLAAPSGADALCRQFASGGGRAGAAGINHLPSAALNSFLAAFGQAFAPPGQSQQ